MVSVNRRAFLAGASLTVLAGLLASRGIAAAKETKEVFEITKTEAEWREILTE